MTTTLSWLPPSSVATNSTSPAVPSPARAAPSHAGVAASNARPSATEAHAAAVTALLDDRYQAVAGRELARLQRRNPAVSDTERGVVEASLHDVVERLLLVPLRAHPEIADQVRVLFDLPDVTPELPAPIPTIAAD